MATGTQADEAKPVATANAGGRRRTIGLWDRVLMSDIGLVKLLAGGRVLFCVPAGMAAGFAIAGLFGLPPVVGLMLGALPAFLTCFVVVDEKASRVAARSAALLVPFVLALFCSIALREFRVLELVLIVLLLFVQFYSSRFGVWAGDFGGGLFAAYLCGLLLPLPLASFPSLALIFTMSMAATIAIRSILFHPNAYRSLSRARRAFVGRQTRVLEAAATLLEAPADSNSERDAATLQRRRRQSHEASLITDGLLAKPGSGPTGVRAEQLHTLLFDIEQTVDGLARVAVDLAQGDTPAPVRARIAAAIELVLDESGRAGDRAAAELLAWADSEPIVATDPRWAHAVNRTALLLSDLASSSAGWSSLRKTLPTSGEGVPFQSPVVLVGGRPAGAGPILDAEIAGGGMSGPWRRVRVSPPLRTAIQAAVAVAIAEPLAFLVDGQRFYWAVIGVMIVLAGTNSTHDRLRKVASRGIGTVIGGVIGIALVDLLGTTHVWWTLAIVIVSLTLGMYGFTRSYVFWVVGLVVTLCQVYAYSGQFTDTLIVYRLAENLLGALIGVGVSLVILPVATGVMIKRAVLRHLATVRSFLESASALEGGADAAARLRTASRAVDQATYQLEAVLKPMVRFPTGGGSRRDDQLLTVLRGVAGSLSGIAYRGERNDTIDGEKAERLSEIVSVMVRSVTALSEAVAGANGGVWQSSAALLADLDGTLTDSADDILLSYRVHALVRVDEALASLATSSGMTVEGTDAQPDLSARRALNSAGHVRRRFDDQRHAPAN
ncbi:hypothetical protein GCM10025867_42270 [Frondihabitans sucicola]|uniref:Integral membrane bound transporter domain-containing protein n=1 Tax=Frondihabitans sucicola TaxID=1268041 RepID=A0ABN6Y4B3_9MICO|nr:FUSC family protein [Frondihabitans sucicola]BDZ51986.1 hypothetical protein GCM10025867_42270 [Frondihabitans sucicola]